MNRSKVFIVKQKWDEYSHYSKVKALFFNENLAHQFIDEEKKKESNSGCFWIISDRHIRDYEPCVTATELEIIKIEDQQELIDDMFKDGNINPDILDAYWASLEATLIELKEQCS